MSHLSFFTKRHHPVAFLFHMSHKWLLEQRLSYLSSGSICRSPILHAGCFCYIVTLTSLGFWDIWYARRSLVRQNRNPIILLTTRTGPLLPVLSSQAVCDLYMYQSWSVIYFLKLDYKLEMFGPRELRGWKNGCTDTSFHPYSANLFLSTYLYYLLNIYLT